MRFLKKKDLQNKSVLLIISLLWNIFLFTQKPFFTLSPDSATYQLYDINNLIDGHRLPVYKLLHFVLFKISFNNSEFAIYSLIILQTVLSVVVVLLLYDALHYIVCSSKLIMFECIVYGIVVGAFGYNEHILTESLAVSFMTIILWLVIKAIKTEKKLYFILLPIISLISILLRPSFIFLVPLLAVFFAVYFVYHRKNAIIGLVSIFIVTLVIIGCCKLHQNAMGIFCLSDVSFANDMGIIVKAEIYQNSEFSDISQYVVDNIVNSTSEDKCNYAYLVGQEFGKNQMVAYIKSCKRQNIISLSRYYIEKILYPYADSFIVKTASKMNLKMQMLFCLIRVCIFPITYGNLFFVSLVFLIDAVFRSIREKRMLYIEMGTVGCIWCIYILTFMTLYEAPAQRIAVHLIPCVIILFGLVIERVSNIIIKKDN